MTKSLPKFLKMIATFLFAFALLVDTNNSNAAPTLNKSVPETRLHQKLSRLGLPHGSILSDDYQSQGASPYRVGLYSDNGVWDLGLEHFKMFLQEHHVSYVSLKHADILAGALNHSNITTLIMPGGASWEYLKDLGSVGASEISTFVANGGGYIGICAGAFYATSMREGGYATGPYGIGLLEGTAYDGTALETKPFKEGMLDFDVQIEGLKNSYRVALLGGPSFLFTDAEAVKKHIQVWGWFQVVHQPAMIAFENGKGHVFLSAPHLEVEEGRAGWGAEWADPESDWPILEKALNFVDKSNY